MDETQRSRTIEMPAIMRAFHQTIDDDPKILTDPIAPRLINANDDLAWAQPMLDHPFAKQWRASFALRARYAEDALAEGVQRGVRQYVVLGARYLCLPPACMGRFASDLRGRPSGHAAMETAPAEGCEYFHSAEPKVCADRFRADLNPRGSWGCRFRVWSRHALLVDGCY